MTGLRKDPKNALKRLSNAGTKDSEDHAACEPPSYCCCYYKQLYFRSRKLILFKNAAIGTHTNVRTPSRFRTQPLRFVYM